MAKLLDRHRRTAKGFAKWLKANSDQPLWRQFLMFDTIADVEYDTRKKKKPVKAKGKKKKVTV